MLQYHQFATDIYSIYSFTGSFLDSSIYWYEIVCCMSSWKALSSRKALRLSVTVPTATSGSRSGCTRWFQNTGMTIKHELSYICIYYQVVPGTRRGGSFKNRTWLWEPVCLIMGNVSWAGKNFKWIETTELNGNELSWIELNWVELNWVKLNWIEWVSERMSEAMNEWNDMK